jgi:hypothetical protein
MVLFIQGWKHLTAVCVENHLIIKATYSSTWGSIQVKSLTSVPHVNTWKNQLENHMPMHTSEKYYCFMCHKVSNLEIALCSMSCMVWEDTAALLVDIYTLLSWMYLQMNKLMLLNQSNFSVTNVEMLYHIILLHCMPGSDSLFSSFSLRWDSWFPILVIHWHVEFVQMNVNKSPPPSTAV